MRVKNLDQKIFNNSLNREYLLNKEILLYHTEVRINESYDGVKYIHAMVEYRQDNLFGTVDLYGTLIIQKLIVLEGYEPPLPLRVKLTRWYSDTMRLFNDVEILNPEDIDSYFIHNVPFGWDEDIKKAIKNVEEYQQHPFKEWIDFMRKDNDNDNHNK